MRSTIAVNVFGTSSGNNDGAAEESLYQKGIPDGTAQGSQN